MSRIETLIGMMLEGKWSPPIAELIGMKLVECQRGTAVFEMHAGSQHHNPGGIVHGGVMVDIMDAAMGMAFASTLKEGENFATISLQVNYLSPVVEEKLVARAHVVKRGKSVGFLEARLEGEDGRLVATSQSSCKIFHRPLPPDQLDVIDQVFSSRQSPPERSG